MNRSTYNPKPKPVVQTFGMLSKSQSMLSNRIRRLPYKPDLVPMLQKPIASPEFLKEIGSQVRGKRPIDPRIAASYKYATEQNYKPMSPLELGVALRKYEKLPNAQKFY
jgi:hypothetical protein